MSLAQFLLPGEAVLFEARDRVFYRRSAFSLYVTGARLLLYAAAGRLSSGERAVAEPLAGLESVVYTEGGLFAPKGRLEARFPGHTLALSGSPDVMKEVWRALQRHALARESGGSVDEEATLVAPLPPLFDDQAGPPTQVEPLPAAALPSRPVRAPGLLRPAVIAALFCLVALAAVVGLLWRRAAPAEARAEQDKAEARAPAAPQPTPTPAPVTVKVLDEVFTLEEGSHRAVKFGVPAGAGGARVSGGFRVTSGSYVDFYVMRNEQYDRYAFGESPDVASVVYREEQWNARVGERLGPGDYFLVFDNRDSGDEDQTIAAEFFLVFNQPAAP